MATEQDITTVRVQTLERIVERGQVWPRMAQKYGVTNPVPPWKSSVDGICDALDREGTVLPLLTRRCDEDRLSQDVYAALPFPENQLVALAHSLIARNVIDEAALANRMKAVRARLEAGEAQSGTTPTGGGRRVATKAPSIATAPAQRHGSQGQRSRKPRAT